MFLAVLAGIFMIVIDTTIVNVAVPGIRRDLHGTVTALQWVVNGYNLAFAALLLSAGALGDRIGARRTFAVGLAGFTLGSLCCGLAPGLWMLAGARFAQGISAALMLPTGLTLAGHLYPAADERARAFARWSAVAGAAMVLGPPAGGILIGSLGWRAVFLVNVPVGVLALIVLPRRGTEPPRRGGMPGLGGHFLGIVLLGAVTVALTESAPAGWFSPAVLGAIGTALLAAVALAFLEGRSERPLIPAELARQPRFTASAAVGAILSIGVYGQMFVLSLYFQDIRGYPASVTGFALLPFAATTALGSLIAGRATIRRGPRPVLLAGQLAGAGGSLLLTVATTTTPYPALAAALFLLGACQAACQPAVTSAAMLSAPPEHAGIASGALAAARQTGAVIGVALLGSLVSDQRCFIHGMHTALFAAAALFVAGIVTAWTLIPRRTAAPGGTNPHPPRKGSHGSDRCHRQGRTARHLRRSGGPRASRR
jgi:DHA2 family methylenomycin A resistance protein-like MFS transporter